MKGTNLKNGDQLTLEIKRLGINGEGIGYHQKQVIFVKGALPGEKVTALVTRPEASYTEAELQKVERPSPDRITPPCPVYEVCGGCQLQHLAYSAQLTFKQDLIRQALEKYTKLDLKKVKLKETIGMDEPFRYRNKNQFQTRTNARGELVSGLFQIGSHRLVPIDDCLVQTPQTVELTQTVREALNKLHIPAYNERKETGIIKTIVTRIGVQTGEMQLVLVTRTEEIPHLEELLKIIRETHPEVVSIMQNRQPEETARIFGAETILLWGKETITEKMGDMMYDLSARAFFQLNPSQTEKLYQEVKNALTLTGKEKIVDAYCGVGTIGLMLAPFAGEVRGMDTIPEAIEDARKNAAKNQLDNVQYEVGDAKTVFQKWQQEGYEPDAVVVDPPRTGLDAELIRSLMQMKPKQVIYVSCNPSTLARDLAVLNKRYRIRSIQPLDMFPQTAHTESITILKRRNYK
ncbi:23S rRNA (uracil(1939)-C(5))-methyltransferase RlmD [Listeria costaricensis]|uniref:23S rRNA (uracil(1939)-C(5))-methyltransferase RlmD n=1 Tax=Listeria costaricensis TaxID=2026604 RepID=UPI001F08C135|nr:23S rRNA (uracil(1939)-C(5))-methyltransferase RlmD [Listeria costaricensis]